MPFPVGRGHETVDDEPMVSFNGGVGSLVLDTFGQKYHYKVIQPEKVLVDCKLPQEALMVQELARNVEGIKKSRSEINNGAGDVPLHYLKHLYMLGDLLYWSASSKILNVVLGVGDPVFWCYPVPLMIEILIGIRNGNMISTYNFITRNVKC
ncbi:hypothetical protein LWI28_025771 [Acer negundo]|uniref:Uncharacterized protein n=1 Tax=Acer negundo TaxID=4023 RepID=A0AAD5IAW4_ACENE|nr:hypothetical protein LWI28_025771 [Acer negundo]